MCQRKGDISRILNGILKMEFWFMIENSNESQVQDVSSAHTKSFTDKSVVSMKTVKTILELLSDEAVSSI